MTTSISVSDEIHAEIKARQAELLKKNKRIKMLELNDFLIQKGLENYSSTIFLKEHEKSPKNTT